MDPHLRWLRRYVATRVAERVLVEAVLVGGVAATATGLAGATAPDAALVCGAAAVTFAVLRVVLGIGTGPVTHRYLLEWRDPTWGLQPAAGGPAVPQPAGAGLEFAVRLERSTGDGPDPDLDANVDQDGGRRSGLDVHRVDGDRVLVIRSDAGETTALSRLGDGRALVTCDGFVPPVAALVVKRVVVGRREDPLDVVLADHRRQRQRLAALGVDCVGIEPGAVIGLVRTEWRAWQELGPIIGPLVALGPPTRFRPGLSVDVPPAVVLARTERSSGRRRNRPESGQNRNGGRGAAVPRARASKSAVPADHRGAPHP
ncbi:MAG: hypothetical protein AAGA93_10060 [Actinomycetota bacterium]